MAEDNFTLTTFYTSWKAFQDEIKRAIAPVLATSYIRSKIRKEIVMQETSTKPIWNGD